MSQYFKISLLCKIANVNKSGYYKSLLKKNVLSQDEIIIKEIFYSENAKVGSRTICMLAKKYYGKIFNRKKVQRIMKKLHLICCIRKKSKINQKLSEEQYIKENILNRHFNSQLPNTVVCTDITYLYYHNSKCYLSAFIDVKTGVVLEYQLSQNLNRHFVLESFENLIKNNPNIKMVHSDRGPQYTCKDFHDLTLKYKIVHSMSNPGTPLDNAVIESFWGHMKDYLSLKNCKTFKDVCFAIDKYMFEYNNRPQWNKKKMTPLEFCNMLIAA